MDLNDVYPPGYPNHKKRKVVEASTGLRESITRHGWVSSADDTNLVLSTDDEGTVEVAMNPYGNTDGTVTASFASKDLDELCKWYLSLRGWEVVRPK